MRWHPFQLNPDLPAEGVARSSYLAQKFGSADTSRIYANVQRAAGAVDLSLAIDAIARQPNTLRAHALMAAAPDEAPAPTSAVDHALAGIDPDALSPREALEALYQLKKLAGG